MLREFMILSRGGQGGVTASRILAAAAAVEGKWAQAVPEFGAERRGAIVRSYLRVSEEPIRRRSAVREPEGVAVFSRRIIEITDVNKLAPPPVPLLLNSEKGVVLGERRVFYVDATGIALKLGLLVAGWPLVNTAMAAAMAKTFNIASLESVKKAMGDYFRGKTLEANLAAAELAWESVRGL